MKSGGRTTDVGVGRQLLCKEKPNTPATSTCAKKLTATVKAAKKGLTAKQQKLWRKYVYTSALLQAQRFCDAKSKKVQLGPTIPGGRGTSSPGLTVAQKYSTCVNKVLTGSAKFKGLFGKQFKWSDYLINGAKMIKKIPATVIKTIDPYVDDPYGTQSN